MKYCLVLLAVLSGCSTISTTQTKLPRNPFPEDQLVSCPKLPLPEKDSGSEVFTVGNLMQYNTSLQSLYNDCAIRHDSLIDLIQKENIKIIKFNKEIEKD